MSTEITEITPGVMLQAVGTLNGRPVSWDRFRAWPRQGETAAEYLHRQARHCVNSHLSWQLREPQPGRFTAVTNVGNYEFQFRLV